MFALGFRSWGHSLKSTALSSSSLSRRRSLKPLFMPIFLSSTRHAIPMKVTCLPSTFVPVLIHLCPVTVPEESPLPDVVPNTFEDEPSVVDSNTIVPPRRIPTARQPEPEAMPDVPAAPAPRRKLTRRATSRASSRAPSPPAPHALPSQQVMQQEPVPPEEESVPEAEPVPQRRVSPGCRIVRQREADRTELAYVDIGAESPREGGFS